jgi:uncharacterized protein (TIGR03067 family)
MQKEIEKLQGNWNIVSLEMDGRTMSAASLGGARIAIQGDRFTSIGMGATYEGTIALDPSANPKAFSLNFTTGPEKGNANLGIYELNGDTWRICLATHGPKRPQTFAAAPGSGIALEILKRGEPESAPPPMNFDHVNFEPAPELAGVWSMVSGAFDGLPLEKSFLKLGKRVVEGNEMSVTFGREVYSKAKFTVDRSKTPIALDIYNTAGANTGKVQYAIYEIDGKTLKLSIAAAGQERPTDFSSKAGDGRTVVTWTRN